MNLETQVKELSPRLNEYLVLYLGRDWYLKRISEKIDIDQNVNELDPQIKRELLHATISMGIIQGIEFFGSGLGLYYLMSRLI